MMKRYWKTNEKQPLQLVDEALVLYRDISEIGLKFVRKYEQSNEWSREDELEFCKMCDAGDWLQNNLLILKKLLKEKV